MEIKNVACVGAGLIGHIWETLFAWKGYRVFLQDLRTEALEQASSEIHHDFKLLFKTGLLKGESGRECIERIRFTTPTSLL